MSGMQICQFMWAAFLVVWVIWAIRTKPTQTREGILSRLSYIVPTGGAFYIMFSRDAAEGWLSRRMFPASFWIEIFGVAITAAGFGLAIWARAYLGGNWSSTVTVKVGHQLIRTGPYRWVRHPIYSGMILAAAGTASEQGQVRGLVAVVLLYAGFKIKSKIEEHAMVGVFGEEYDKYSLDTGAIFPRFQL